MTRLLIDHHHDDLFHSLQLLFEKRLGWEVFRPAGLDWYHQGYWHVYPHIDTARQFLDIHGESAEDFRRNHPEVHLYPLNNDATEQSPGIYLTHAVTKPAAHKCITLEAFKSMKFDILVASIPQHIAPFQELIRLYQPHAKLIFQIGNMWGVPGGVSNILSSTSSSQVPPGINACFYHQEFDTSVFHPAPSPLLSGAAPAVFSFIHWMKGKSYMDIVAERLPGWNFRSFGAGMEDHVSKTADVAEKMRQASFIWQHKPEGDGYGHGIHNAFSVGRPPIIWNSHYYGRLAAALMQNGVTCIDAEQHTTKSLPNILKLYAEPGKHEEMCQAAAKRFKEVVDFDAEFVRIRTFLENLR